MCILEFHYGTFSCYEETKQPAGVYGYKQLSIWPVDVSFLIGYNRVCPFLRSKGVEGLVTLQSTIISCVILTCEVI